MSNSLTHPIIILSGEENVGKSTLCRQITDYAKTRKIMVSGILSELETVKGQKKAINSFDIKSDEKINLAVYSPGWDKEKKDRKWKFNREAIKWGNRALRNSVPTDLLIIDEIGYLELEKGEGWKECFSVLEGNQYHLAIIVIRLELLSLIIKRY
jgi:nucleoside-triphosphatase THEP1